MTRLLALLLFPFRALWALAAYLYLRWKVERDIDRLQREIGRALIPTLTEAVQALVDAMDSLNRTADENSEEFMALSNAIVERMQEVGYYADDDLDQVPVELDDRWDIWTDSS